MLNADIVEGAIDKSEAGLRAILRNQAKLRIFVAIPVVLIEAILFLLSSDNIAGRLVALTACYCAYIFVLHILVSPRSNTPARQLLVVTAVMDPLALSAWLVVTGEYGSLIVGFFLFTILGFGFRTGRPLMHLCQLTSIVAFMLVFLSVPYWQQHPTLFIAMMLPLMAVPMYAGKLIGVLRESREHAEHESQAKSELLAKVSHELRTPLTGIISATELLASEVGSPVVVKRTDTILTLSNQLLHEINDLLDEAKFGARAVKLGAEPVDIRRQLDLLCEALGATASKKGIELRIAIDAEIVDPVESDAHHLGRVLMNLASNAVKFTDHGQVEVAAQLHLKTDTEYHIRFSVTDTGIGIPESFHNVIFEPFAQVDQGASRKYGGTGLGLAISRQVVDLMGGTLAFESVTGKGSRFWFDVRLKRTKALAPNLIFSVADPGAAASKSLKILVAEDNETNLLLIRELLQIDGHEVTTCASGTEALDLLCESEFDLLLLDYNLGDMDGLRVLQTYHFGCPVPAPTLFLTADTTQATAARLREFAGDAGVLYKPITLTKLRSAIGELGSTIQFRNPSIGLSPLLESSERRVRTALEVVAISALDQGVIDELKSVSVRLEFFPTLLIEAEHDIRRSGQLILEALADSEYGSLRDAAHALKGVSANVGAVRLFALASKLMAASREDLDTAGERWSADLAEALRITIAALQVEVRDASHGLRRGGTASLHLE